MTRVSRLAAFGILLGAGLAVLAGIPTDGSTIANEAKVGTLASTASSASSPHPELLERLAAAVASSAAAPINPAKQDPLETPSAQTVSLSARSEGGSVSSDAGPEVTYIPATGGKSAVNLRAGPSSATRNLAVLHPGEVVRVAQITRGWAQVMRTDGSTGWVYSSFLSSFTVLFVVVLFFLW